MRSGLGPQVRFSFLVSSFQQQRMIAGTKDIQIVVNGQLRAVPRGQSVVELLVWLGIDGGRVAVELDRSILRREEWDKTEVSDGAALEIVQFVGGG
jgi:sulfur carrier protein